MTATVADVSPPNPGSAVPVPPAPGPEADPRTRITDALRRTGTGDRAAFRELYALTDRLVFGIVLRILGRRDLAEEVTQDVYLTVWRRAGGYDAARGNPLAWLAAIARNRAIDRLRAERSRGFVIGVEDLPEIDADEDHAAAVGDRMTLERLLATLRPEHRQALLLAYFGGYTNSELAERMGVPAGTLKSWLRRGLTALREAME